MTQSKQKSFKSKSCKTPEEALAYVQEIYNSNIEYLHEQFHAFTKGQLKTGARVSANYPYIRMSTDTTERADTRKSYGFVPRVGTYETTLTSPDIFNHYYHEQFRRLIKNHNVPLEVGVSDTPIPIHFALGTEFHLEGDLTPEKIERLADLFDVPNLDIMDDEIANSTYRPNQSGPLPLALFTAPRVDISLQRLKHYTGTSAHHFQNFVIFTNYQFYIDQFVELCMDLMAPTEDEYLKTERAKYTAFVEPGNKVTPCASYSGSKASTEGAFAISRLPQMPAYHLKTERGMGITMVNIGVGPSNAKTITDHIAVLRPHVWLMLGHCAGLRNSQQLGDYVLAHGYLREDNILDEDLPPSIPIPALAEVQQALELAVAQVTGLEGYDLKKVMRTGTVATTDDRNWELHRSERQNTRLSQSRAIAMDMESGTIAANGFRFRVPYGTLLCVSDKPLHGQLKLPGMADSFYRERVNQHLKIGLLTMQLLGDQDVERLHSRKLRSFNEVAFQ